MKPLVHWLRTLLAGVLLTGLATNAILAQIPQTISFQGVALDGSGNPVVDGSHELTISLYDKATEGTAAWTETQTVETVGGVFSVELGAVSPLDLPFDVPYWLGTSVDTGGELEPRIPLTSVPYSLMSVSVAPEGVAVSDATEGQVLTVSGGAAAWQNPAQGGIVDIEKIDVSGGSNGDVLTIADGAASWEEPSPGGVVDPDDIGTEGAANGQVLTVDAGTATWKEPPSGGAIDPEDITTDSGSNGQVLTIKDGTASWETAQVGEEGSVGWLLGGNAGTTDSQFVGTTDDRALELRVNDVRALRLEPFGQGTPTLIGGSSANEIVGNIEGGTIAGGGNGSFPNRVEKNWVAIGGGEGNIGSGVLATVGGGHGNTASGMASTVGAGLSNSAGGGYSTVGGGEHNSATGDHSAVGAGYYNQVLAKFGTISGGGPSDETSVLSTRNVVYDEYGTIGGGGGNEAGTDGSSTDQTAATVSGGLENVAGGEFSTVGGGADNTADGARSTIGGGSDNTASEFLSTVGGGAANSATALAATIGGGNSIAALGEFSTVAGGGSIEVSGNVATVGGGVNHSVSGEGGTVGGGQGNRVYAVNGTVGGGGENPNQGINGNAVYDDFGTIGGGGSNATGASGSTTDQIGSTVSGGLKNTASGESSTVGGGINNLAKGDYSTIGGGGPSDLGNPDGTRNAVYDEYGTIGGGGGNVVGKDEGSTQQARATVSGGFKNQAIHRAATVGGGEENIASGRWSTVGGGWSNLVEASFATIGGGGPNDLGNPGGTRNAVYDTYGTIGGGGENRVGVDDGSQGNQSHATVGGGNQNTAGGAMTTIGGGSENSATGEASTISGGEGNSAFGEHAAVGGGGSNFASGSFATVPGGVSNSAAGDYSLAAGDGAKANHDYTFVWSGSAGTTQSTAPSQFIVKAPGGVGINTTAPSNQLHVTASTAEDDDTDIESYVALIENTGIIGPDALALKVGSLNNPSSIANFIGFFNSNSSLIGQIDGNGSGGINYKTTGADYAEYLPHRAAGEVFEAGDLVGVKEGSITRQTMGVARVMVITDRASVSGNMPRAGDNRPYELVSFVGQVAARVRGPVLPGDYIIPSGLNDGTGIAVDPDEVTLEQAAQLVGLAWESAAGGGVHRVTIEVGLDRLPAAVRLFRHQQSEIAQLQSQIDELRRVLATLNNVSIGTR